MPACVEGGESVLSKVDIIVPVYNAGKYLEAMIQSVLAQSYKDYSLILVSDCSVDNSKEICDKYAGMDERIQVIHNRTNCGAGASRDAGYMAGHSEWVTFVDADDILMPGFLTELFALVKDDVDMCGCCVGIEGKPEGRIVADAKKELAGVFDGKEIFHKIYTLGEGGVGKEPCWGKIIRRKLIEIFISDLRMRKELMPRTYFNDIPFSPYLWYYCRKVAYTDQKLYLYRYRSDSISHKKFFNEHYRQQVIACGERIRFLSTIPEKDTLVRQTLNCFAIVSHMYYIMCCSVCDDKLKQRGERTISEFIYDNQKYVSVRGIYNFRKLLAYINARVFCWNKKIWFYTLGKIIYKEKMEGYNT